MAVLVEQTHLLSSAYDSVRFQLHLHTFLTDFPLSKGEINALAVFYTEGIQQSSIDKILSLKIFKNRQTVENFLTKLIKLEVIKKTGKKQREFTNLIPVKVDNQILINLKIGNK